jgi:hypothetical protein
MSIIKSWSSSGHNDNKDYDNNITLITAAPAGRLRYNLQIKHKKPASCKEKRNVRTKRDIQTDRRTVELSQILSSVTQQANEHILI